MEVLIISYVLVGLVVTGILMDNMEGLCIHPTNIAQCMLMIVFLPVVVFVMTIINIIFYIIFPIVSLVFMVIVKLDVDELLSSKMQIVKKTSVYKFLFDKF